VLVLALAACGGVGGPKTEATPLDALPGGRTLYRSGDWAVVVKGTRVLAVHRAGDVWRADRSRKVRIRILGPQPGARAAARPQLAVEMTARQSLAESQIWLDGKALFVKGGGSPTRGTIYAAPDASLRPGTHVAVAYARTASSATAVAWSFRV